jgi:hypothetical protein
MNLNSQLGVGENPKDEVSMVKLTMISKEYALQAPDAALPSPATKVVRNELWELVQGTPCEAEVREWFKGWVAQGEALALIAELRAEAKAEAKHKLPAQPLEVVVKANAQSNQRALERAKAEMEEAERKRQQTEYVRRAQIANEQAVELGYAQRQWEALAARRYDPLGVWGPANYKTQREDW